MPQNTTKKGLEDPDYLQNQLITYIGNKRSLLDFIQQGFSFVQEQTGKKKLVTFDVFSGSGIVSRMMKQYSSLQYANDLENYARIISSCYLSNKKQVNLEKLSGLLDKLTEATEKKMKSFLNKDMTAFKGSRLPGFISEYYAPRDLNDIQAGERCFYTPYNACFIDVMRQNIGEMVDEELQKFFIAPLLSEASVHANTGGVFKGFYKNSKTGVGKFGGNGENALSRIQGHIHLELPVLSKYSSKSVVFQSDANALVLGPDSPKVDVAYIDPPYNQHPYGSNYFMLNLIASYQKPDADIMSRVSGIPKDWNRSLYNKKKKVQDTFLELVENLKASYLLVSFNNEGFISEEEMVALLSKVGNVTTLESEYNAYRASRNLGGRNIHTKEFLYVVSKN